MRKVTGLGREVAENQGSISFMQGTSDKRHCHVSDKDYPRDANGDVRGCTVYRKLRTNLVAEPESFGFHHKKRGSAMNRSIEQALTSLIPRCNGAFPLELIELSSSLLAQSRNKASNLKAEEEIGRTYACANIACER